MSDPVVLVPLDGSKNALRAMPVARRLAALEKAHVHILHVTDEVGPLDRTADALGLAPADLRGATLEVRGGSAAQAILATARDCRARLIVMCADTGDDVAPAGAISAAALAVLRDAPCAVVLVDPARAPDGWALRRVLALHDGSPTVSDALRPAAELAHAAGAEFVVLQVADGAGDLEAGSIAPPRYVDQVQYSWPAWSQEFLQRLAIVCPLADMRVRLLVAHGECADETIRVAKEESADLVVMACKGDWEASHTETLKALLAGAPCPVMATRLRAV